MNKEAFEAIKSRIISLVPPRCNIKIYIENYDTGYELEIMDGNCQIKKDNRGLMDTNFLDYISKVSKEEFLLFSPSLEVEFTAFVVDNRKFRFILETRMLIVETFFRNTDNEDVFNYSLYKHLSMYYNCRAKSSNTATNPKIPQILCRNFKGVYLAVPAFTSFVSDISEDYLDMKISQFHEHVRPVYSTKFEPINSMPSISAKANEDKMIDIYTFTSLYEKLAELRNLPSDNSESWILAEAMLRNQYNEGLFVEYWYTDLIKTIIDPNFANKPIVMRQYVNNSRKMYFTLTLGDTASISEDFQFVSREMTLSSLLDMEIRRKLESGG